MSDPTSAKRLRTEARNTCSWMEEAAKKIAAWIERAERELVPPGELAELREIALAIAHQGGRLDMAVSMAHVRSKK